ncbi:hypothetical protein METBISCDRAFT_24346 [Metschnikowia bicuspidata]|uniref:Cyclin N-terminal domain-containing protein n=1 Tax=Metschnikowia bicuspidata TaxID=27322 RepID=A0A4P9ZB84_9ASCO|nr:hypothetical protein METBISCDRAFT_24346 [Metschnikowia bicuspidata]
MLTSDSESGSPKSPVSPTQHYSPKDLRYYSGHLNKAQFNLILINCTLNLLKLIYTDVDHAKLRYFIVEMLRRSKTTTQSVQICCYYFYRILRGSKDNLPLCPKKLFLGMIILSSKFNQDHNYSFKTWLKICGCHNNDNSASLNLCKLKQIEMLCLRLLDYNLYINTSKYENWCNMLFIFGYDFISLHEVVLGVIFWCTDDESAVKLLRWLRFLLRMDDKQLSNANVNFKRYYAKLIGNKVVTSGPKKAHNLFAKRPLEETDVAKKRVC